MLPTVATQDTRAARGQQIRSADVLVPLYPLPNPRRAEDPKLLPTPAARDAKSGQDMRQRQAAGRQVGLNDLAVTLFPLPKPGENERLLPTPTARDGAGGQALDKRGRRAKLNDLAVGLFPLSSPRSTDKLLPTPRASDGTKGSANQRGSKGDLTLPSAVIRLNQTPERGPTKRRSKRPPPPSPA